MSSRERWAREDRIREEERIRHEERQKIERQDANREYKAQKAHENDVAYVEELGSSGAAQVTLFKWVVGGFIISILSLMGGIQERGFLEAFKASAAVFGVFCVIGIWRAAKYKKFNQ